MSHYIEGESFAEVYDQLLTAAYERPDHVCRPRGIEVKELIAPTIRVLDPTNRFYTSPARTTPMRYVAGEFLWYFGLRNDAEFISQYSAFWNQIKNQYDSPDRLMEKDRVNSSYGHLLMAVEDAYWEGKYVSQWEWALRSMLKDPDTRQAVMHINRPSHQVDWVRDFPCTMTLQFLIRDRNLHLYVHMRSNDLIMGLTFDFPMFSFFQETMLEHLKSVEPANRDLKLGHLTLTATSSHIYERNYQMVEQMIGNLAVLGPIEQIAVAPVEASRDGDQIVFQPSIPMNMLTEHAEGHGNYTGSFQDMGLGVYTELSKHLGPK